MKIISVVGARPNFIKVAPIDKELKKYTNIQHLICHTGQHHDINMSDIFFKDLGISEPHFHLNISGGSHVSQAAQIMMKFEEIILEEKPDLVIVYGDVNSTLAAAMVTSKLGIKTAHVEAGLRSFDRTMPEEINRILTDTISDYLFVTEKSGVENLKKEGIDDSKVFLVGNVVMDTLSQNLEAINNSKILDSLQVNPHQYILSTFHRPSNVDTQKSLTKLVEFLNELAEENIIIFPAHPRTTINLAKFGLTIKLHQNIKKIGPLGYIDFSSLVENAKLIITDSGGVQEESTFLGVQCITVRENTERPITIEVGTNQLAGESFEKTKELAQAILEGKIKKGSVPELWDGKTAERIIKIILEKI